MHSICVRVSPSMPHGHVCDGLSVTIIMLKRGLPAGIANLIAGIPVFHAERSVMYKCALAALSWFWSKVLCMP